MHEELQLALMGLVTPERLWVLLEANRVLEALGSEDHADELQQVFGMQDGIADNNLLVGRVEDVLMIGVGSALRQYGVVCRDDTPLDIMVAVLSAMGNVEHYFIPETLYDYTQADWSPEEIVAEVVPLLTGVSAAEVFDYVAEVSPRTIARLRQIALDNMAYHEPEDAETQDIRNHRIRILNTILRHTGQAYPQVVVGLAKSGLRSGMPLASLLADSLDRLDEFNTEAMGHELLGLVVFSNTPLDELLETTHQTIEEFSDDYEEQQRMILAINEWRDLLGVAS